MSKRNLTEAEWIEASARLPRSLPPERDLWPGIAARMTSMDRADSKQAPARRWLAPALAASLVAALVVTVISLQPGAPSPGSAEPFAEVSAPDELMAVVAASEREYRGEFRSFSPAELNLGWIDTDGQQGIAESWTAMHETEQALLAALEASPDNTLLGTRLMDLRARQLGLMRKLHMLDQDSRRTT